MTLKTGISATLSALTLCLGATSAQAVLVDRIAAGVNNDVILLSDVERFHRTEGLRRELDPLFGLSDDVSQGKLTKSKVLDFLIQEHLINQTFKISDAEVDQEVQSVQKNNNLTKDQLSEFLSNKGYTYADYFELMRTGLAKRNLLDREIRTRVNISEDDIRNYVYNNELKDTAAPMEYSLQLITISNKTYKTPKLAETAASEAMLALKQGEAFKEVASRLSDDPSAENGGELGFLPSDQLAGPLRDAAKRLQIGAISDLIKTPSGFMIIKLVDARSTESQKFLELKEQVRERLAKEEYKKQLQIWAERARNDAHVHVN